MPYVLLATGQECAPWARHASPQTATDAPIRIPSSGADANHTGTRAPTGTVDDSDCPLLAQEGMVHRGHGTARRRAVVSPHAQRYAVSSLRTDTVPSVRNLGPVSLVPEREKLMATGLPDNVIDTIQSTRAASTQGLYMLKWRMFEAWCTERNFQSSVVDILTFLQELLERGLSYSFIKVDLSAISACHVGFQGTSPGSLWWCAL